MVICSNCELAEGWWICIGQALCDNCVQGLDMGETCEGDVWLSVGEGWTPTAC